MDSTYNYIHWEKSNLPILADDWTGDKLPEEPIVVPEGINRPNAEDLGMEMKKKERIPWHPNPIDD
jgi:hypothetical protein